MRKVRKHGWYMGICAAVLFFLWCMRIDEGEQATVTREGGGEEQVAVSGGEERQETDRGAATGGDVSSPAEIGYIPELGYCNMTMGGSGDYACWKDMLILRDCIYRKKNDVYVRTNESVHDLFGPHVSGDKETADGIKQYKNLLITRRVSTFLVRNMDTGTVRSYRCSRFVGNTDIEVGSDWYLYDGRLYYMVSVKEKDISSEKEECTTMIRYLDLKDGNEGIFFAPDKNGQEMRRQFMIRDNGLVITELISRMDGCETELCRIDQQGNVVGRTGIRYKEEQGSSRTEKWLAYNGEGLFVRNNIGSGFGNTGVYCWQEDGGGKEIGIREINGVIFTAQGYFLCSDMSFYDFYGNRTVTYPLAAEWREGDEGAETPLISLKNVVYDGERFLAFYEDSETGILQIRQAHMQESDHASGQSDVLQMAGAGREVISVISGQARGNLRGYRFEKEWVAGPAYYMTYVRMPDRLFPQQIVGRGIYVSEHISETESFLGGMLTDILIQRGKVKQEQAVYFSDHAIGQMEEWEEIIPDNWLVDPFRYDVSSERNHLYGKAGYDFLFVFHEMAEGKDQGSGKGGEESNREQDDRSDETEVRIRVTADSDGRIRGLEIRTEGRSEGHCGWGDRRNRLPDDMYGEQIIRNGVRDERAVLLNFEQFWRQDMDGEELRKKIAAGLSGLAAPENAAECGEQLEMILRDMLDGRGEYITEYRSLFSDWRDYERFSSLDWERLNDDWTADREYDCYYMDETKEQGRVRFRYYLYPDFGIISADEAQAVIFDCEIDSEGYIRDTDMVITSVTRDEREKAAEENEGKVPVILNGEAACAGNILVPVSRVSADPVSFDRYEPDLSGSHGTRMKAITIWGYEDTTQAAAYLGEKIKKKLNERTVCDGEIYAMFIKEEKAKEALQDMEWRLDLAGSRWQAADGYDCYIMEDELQNGCIHLRYYFYRYKAFEGRRRDLVTDVRLSERGIEDMRTCMAVSREADG